MIKNIIFDFDGVLVDSEILVARAFNRYLYEKNIAFNEKEYSKFAGKKTIQVIEELSKKFNIQNKKKFFEDIMNLANNIFSTELTAIKGVKKFLKNNDFNYFIGSNSIKKRVLYGLNKVGLDKLIKEEEVFSFDMVKRPKPYPDVYLKVVNTYKLKKSESIIIEDSKVGVEAGVSSGIKVIGLTAGKHWQSDRSDKELIDAGAFVVSDNYDNVLSEIKKI
jgi:beta-phosphoglucomutase-like phosphatase (HAD superfamily)